MKAHRTDGVSLTFALLFLAVAAWWLVAQLLDLALPAVGWFLAGGLILLGLLGLVGALRSGRAGPPAAPAPADPIGAGPAGPSSGGPTDPVSGGYLAPTSGGHADPTSGGYPDPVSGPSYADAPDAPDAPGLRWSPRPASVEPTTAPPVTGGDERA
jgi:hypothetical protein